MAPLARHCSPRRSLLCVLLGPLLLSMMSYYNYISHKSLPAVYSDMSHRNIECLQDTHSHSSAEVMLHSGAEVMVQSSTVTSARLSDSTQLDSSTSSKQTQSSPLTKSPLSTAVTTPGFTSPPTDEARQALLNDLLCPVGTGQGRANWTCPGCVRPAVHQLNKSFHDSNLKDRFNFKKSPDYFKIRPAVVQPLMTSYLIVPTFNCSDVYLLAVQPSILDRRQERDTVRSTWGSVAREQKWPNRIINANVKVIFVVAPGSGAKGKATSDPSWRLKEIRSEAAVHNDILYVDMIDSYRNLTLKLLSAFKWIKDNCPCVKFVLKVDYDTFVNVPLLVDTLLYFEDRFEFSILGRVYESTRVHRSGKWEVRRSLYPMDSYMAYASGCGYVLSYSALSQIVDAAPHFNILPIEDAFITGVMRRVVGCRMFSFPTMFTHHENLSWHHCSMLHDQKFMGTTKDSTKRHQLVWSTFIKGVCK